VYSKKEELNDNAQPSAKFVKFFMFLDELDANVRALSDVNTMQQTLAHLVAAVAAALIDPTGAFWRSAAFERGGLNQFVLDMRFFVCAAGHYANCAASLIEPAVDSAVDDFANNAGVDRTKLLKSDEWFEERVQAACGTLNAHARASQSLRVVGTRGGMRAVGAAALASDSAAVSSKASPASPLKAKASSAPRRGASSSSSAATTNAAGATTTTAAVAAATTTSKRVTSRARPQTASDRSDAAATQVFIRFFSSHKKPHDEKKNYLFNF